MMTKWGNEEELVWVLFLADFANYAEYHRSITGLTYVKGKHGPLLMGGGPLPFDTNEACNADMKLSREELRRQIMGLPAYVLTEVGEVIDYELAYY